MHAVVRNYSGAGAKQLRNGDGGVSVTVCKEKAGADESLKVARDWIQKNASNTGARPPAVMEGSVIIQIK